MNQATPRQASIIAQKCWTKLQAQADFHAWAIGGGFGNQPAHLDKTLATRLIGPLLEHVRYNNPEKGMQTINWAREELRLAGYDPNKHPIE